MLRSLGENKNAPWCRRQRCSPERCSEHVWDVVISQTRWLVSQERLAPGVGISVFIDLVLPSLGVVLTFEASVLHHTPPPPGGAGLVDQF